MQLSINTAIARCRVRHLFFSSQRTHHSLSHRQPLGQSRGPIGSVLGDISHRGKLDGGHGSDAMRMNLQRELRLAFLFFAALIRPSLSFQNDSEPLTRVSARPARLC